MKRTVYECDGCGERHGHRTEMIPARVRHQSDEWTDPTQETLHICIACDGVGITGAGSSISDVNQAWSEYLVDAGRHVVGLRNEATGEVLLRENLSVEQHGNVAIIRDAMDAVEDLLRGTADD